MPTLFVSTRNRHKLEELRAMLPSSLVIHGVDVLGEVPEIEETAATFADNAKLKALGLARHLLIKGEDELRKWGGFPLWVLADDSGLAVDHLGGAPGVFSARFARVGPDGSGEPGNAPDAENNAKLLRLMTGVPTEKRKARFVCALALVQIRNRNDMAEPLMVEGRCEGSIRDCSGGQGGFGYDPLFQPEGYPVTFAQLSAEEKNRISHRSRALAALRRVWTEVV